MLHKFYRTFSTFMTLVYAIGLLNNIVYFYNGYLISLKRSCDPMQKRRFIKKSLKGLLSIVLVFSIMTGFPVINSFISTAEGDPGAGEEPAATGSHIYAFLIKHSCCKGQQSICGGCVFL